MSVHFPESLSLASILADDACTTRKDLESESLARDNPETNQITIQPARLKTASHIREQFSWVPLPYCSPPGCPFPIKSLALSAHVSPWTIHFRVLDKSPVSGPGRGPPSCNSWTIMKPEHQRIDAFGMFCWRKLLRVLCTAKRYNQSIL